MSTEAEYYEEEMADLLAEVRKGIDGVPKLKGGGARLERLTELQGRLGRAKQVLRAYRLELRDLPGKETAEYEQRAREFTASLQELGDETQAAKEEAERGRLGVRTVDEMTTEEVRTT